MITCQKYNKLMEKSNDYKYIFLSQVTDTDKVLQKLKLHVSLTIKGFIRIVFNMQKYKMSEHKT